MARKLRVEYPGAIYQVMHRGDRREPIFQDDEDRQRFLATHGLPNACLLWERPATLITCSTANGRRNENECTVVDVNDNFEMYVQFAPSDSLNYIGDSIYVTLGIVTWNWAGQANNVGGTWVLTGSNSVSSVSSQPSDSFPIWTNVIINPGNFHTCF
jgi:hypothetical protein